MADLDLTACQVHGTLLLSSCWHGACGRPQRALTSTSRVGWCTSCGEWLGTEVSQPEVAAKRMDWERALAQEVVDVLARAATTPADVVPDTLQQTLDAAGLGVRATARAVGRSKGSVAMWRHGKVVPELDAWARIAAAAQVKLAPLLVDARLVPTMVPTPPELPDRRRKPIDWLRVRRVLRGLANATDFVPLRVSLLEVGVRREGAREHEPVLYEAAKARNWELRHASAERRLADAQARIEEAVLDAKRAGAKPSRRRIERALGASYQLREQALAAKWHDACGGGSSAGLDQAAKADA